MRFGDERVEIAKQSSKAVINGLRWIIALPR